MPATPPTAASRPPTCRSPSPASESSTSCPVRPALRPTASSCTRPALAKTCTNTGAWSKVSAGTLTANHSYTLTLTSHDDNYSGDATYTLFDDVAITVPVTNPFANPGFETGSLSGWTASGAATS